MSVKNDAIVVWNRLAFLYANMPESMELRLAEQSKAALHLRIAATNVSGWCGHGFEFHSQPVADIPQAGISL